MNAATAPVPPRIRVRGAGRRLREFITPEGVDLQLEIAPAILRFAALCIDYILMLLILLLSAWALSNLIDTDSGMKITFLLGFFLLRNFWFPMFELGPRAATPGKRACGIRVVARDGGRLDVSSVIARNLVREVEMGLPIYMLIGAFQQDATDGLLALVGGLWALGLSFFLLFNKDRMRLGDVIGGTWVVMARRGKIAADLGAGVISDAAAGERFTDDELSVYGVFELQELERVLRQRDAKAMRSVADAIRTKLGRPFMGDDGDFLDAYYRAARDKMERDLLFGKRKANKYEAAQ